MSKSSTLSRRDSCVCGPSQGPWWWLPLVRGGVSRATTTLGLGLLPSPFPAGPPCRGWCRTLGSCRNAGPGAFAQGRPGPWAAPQPAGHERCVAGAWYRLRCWERARPVNYTRAASGWSGPVLCLPQRKRCFLTTSQGYLLKTKLTSSSPH